MSPDSRIQSNDHIQVGKMYKSCHGFIRRETFTQNPNLQDLLDGKPLLRIPINTDWDQMNILSIIYQVYLIGSKSTIKVNVQNSEHDREKLQHYANTCGRNL